MADIVGRGGEPWIMEWRQFVARFPVGLRDLTLMRSEEWDDFVSDRIVVEVRAKVLAHQLAPARIPVHVDRLVTQPVPVRRYVEEPATRWDALKLFLGVRRSRVRWRAASYLEVQEVAVRLVHDEEIVVDREHHFPEQSIAYPDALGPSRIWEQVRPQ